MNKFLRLTGTLFILVGFVFLVLSAGMYYMEESHEEDISTYNDHIVDMIENQQVVIVDNHMIIDEHTYMGVLDIPKLNLSLAVQNTWSDELLDISPCVYLSKPLSIAAHNSKAHFKYLNKLIQGDKIILNYPNGDVIQYEVLSVSVIHETDVESLQDEKFDLSLFSCNTRNTSERVLVRCKKTSIN